MITGFNTDVEHDGEVYHVQTEDKGLGSPLILSLVYSRGEILASKRSRYDDLIARGFSDDILADRLKRQHLLICAAIRAGRLEELKRMGQPAAQVSAAEVVDPKAAAKTVIPVEVGSETVSERAPSAASPEALHSETIFEAAATEKPLPVATPEPAGQSEAYSIHDQRRLSPLGELPVDEGLRLSLLDEHDFRAGDSLTLRIMVSYVAGDDEKPLSGVAISVKVLGTTFRPQIYSMKTTRDGIAIVSAQIPKFTSGRAAILIRAVANGSETEMRRVIHPA